MSADNPYESPINSGKAAFDRSAQFGSSFERVRQGALIACWASLALIMLYLAVPLLTKAGWRSYAELAGRTALQTAVMLWLCHGIRLMRAVPQESQARHLLALSLLGWIVSLVIGVVHTLQILTDTWVMPIRVAVLGDAGQLLGKLTLLWAVNRMGIYFHARQVTIAAITAMVLLGVTDLPYLLADVLSAVYSHTPADLAVLHAQLSLLDVPVHWTLYLLMNCAGLFALYALGTLGITPHPEEQTPEAANWKHEFQELFAASRFRWGLTFCWWAMILAIVVPRCSRAMTLLHKPDWLTFTSLSGWSLQIGILCQIIGMGLLWTIRNERVKPWFAWGAILLFAGYSFDVMQYFQGHEMELDTPSARHVIFIADILPILAVWLHLRGFTVLAEEWQDPPMQLRARQALLRFSILGSLWFIEQAMMHYAAVFMIENIRAHETLFYGIIFLVHTTLEILLLLSYIPLLNLTATLAPIKEAELARLPFAEPRSEPSNQTTPGSDHEPESV